ncbi:protein FAM200C-like [Watersipora subatra]|uniref:protein FAM200C-like n=1 Tax=Watersipora subatra TaxID=2589382 RepID=UPI00355BF687
MEDDFPFCKPLSDTTTAADIMHVISEFFEQEDVDLGKLVGACTDGTPAMLSCRSEFVELVKKKNSLIKGTHCFIHREAPAARTLLQSMDDHLSTVIKAVNYIKRHALNSRLFNKLCEDVNASYFSALFYT